MIIYRIFKYLNPFIPFKQKLFERIKTIYTPPHSLFQYLYFKGKIKVDIDHTHAFYIHHYGRGFEIENEAFWLGLKGGWEKVSTQLWIELCKNAKVIFDIGANTGIYSLIAQSINERTLVYAFEPVDRVFDKLALNCSENNYNVHCIKVAVSNYDGEGIIYDLKQKHIYSVTVNKNLHSKDKKVIEKKIITRKLSTFVQENNIGKIDLMKIDVETYEPEVLQGMEGLIEKYKPTMLIEILNDEVAKRIEEIILGKDYLFFNIDEKNRPRLVSHLTKSDFFNFLLCNKNTASQLGLI